MDNRQLENLLRDTSCGAWDRIMVTAFDRLPKNVDVNDENQLIITNTDKANSKGQHWVVLRVGPKQQDGKTVINYFDSLGECKLYGDFEQFFAQFDKLRSNEGSPVQHTEIFSDSCGIF